MCLVWLHNSTFNHRSVLSMLIALSFPKYKMRNVVWFVIGHENKKSKYRTWIRFRDEKYRNWRLWYFQRKCKKRRHLWITSDSYQIVYNSEVTCRNFSVNSMIWWLNSFMKFLFPTKVRTMTNLNKPLKYLIYLLICEVKLTKKQRLMKMASA